MVCDKVGCDKAGCDKVVVWQMLCDKVVCVWQSCVWQSWLWKMVCDKDGFERWCVTKLGVKDGVWQSCVWQTGGGGGGEGGEIQKCRKCHACHAKRRWMSPSAMSATWNEGGCRQVPRLPPQSTPASPATNRAQARHQSQPSAASVTPATISWYYHYHQWLGDGHRKQRNIITNHGKKTKNIITIKSWSMIMSPLKGCAERHECSKTWWLIIWLS